MLETTRESLRSKEEFNFDSGDASKLEAGIATLRVVNALHLMGHAKIKLIKPPKGAGGADITSENAGKKICFEVKALTKQNTGGDGKFFEQQLYDKVFDLIGKAKNQLMLSAAQLKCDLQIVVFVVNGEISVSSSVVNGKRGDTKTEARKNTVPVIQPVRELLDLYRLRLGAPTAGVMFATALGTPLDLHNLFSRQIDPVLNACEQCGKARAKHRLADHEYRRRSDLVQWRGWHAFRRGLASNLNELGVHDLTIQRILRHSNVATTRKPTSRSERTT